MLILARRPGKILCYAYDSERFFVMADKEQVELLKSDVEAWNQWREANPTIEPDLRKANLSWAVLSGADLSEADLYGADLTEAKLIGANLIEAVLIRANLMGGGPHRREPRGGGAKRCEPLRGEPQRGGP